MSMSEGFLTQFLHVAQAGEPVSSQSVVGHALDVTREKGL